MRGRGAGGGEGERGGRDLVCMGRCVCVFGVCMDDVMCMNDVLCEYVCVVCNLFGLSVERSCVCLCGVWCGVCDVVRVCVSSGS